MALLCVGHNKVNIGVAHHSTGVGGIGGLDNLIGAAAQHSVLGDVDSIANVGVGALGSPLQLIGGGEAILRRCLLLNGELNSAGSRSGGHKQAVLLQLQDIALALGNLYADGSAVVVGTKNDAGIHRSQADCAAGRQTVQLRLVGGGHQARRQGGRFGALAIKHLALEELLRVSQPIQGIDILSGNGVILGTSTLLENHICHNTIPPCMLFSIQTLSKRLYRYISSQT